MNYVTRRRLSRRTLLRGGGAAVALPWLDAMLPAFAGNDIRRPPSRLAVVYVPNGIVMEEWSPVGTGTEFTCGRILKPLEAFRDNLTIIERISQSHGIASNSGGSRLARDARPTPIRST